MSSQEWYAVLRHRRGNPDTRFAVTCPYCRTLSTLPGFELELAGAERYRVRKNSRTKCLVSDFRILIIETLTPTVLATLA